MKITIFVPQSEFTKKQQKTLSDLGQVNYVPSRGELSEAKLLDLSRDSNIIAPDPDAFGGFEKASPLLTKLIEALPDLVL